jgi:hypothetical protein
MAKPILASSRPAAPTARMSGTRATHLHKRHGCATPRRRQGLTTLNDELRRLQRTMAILIACQAAAEEGAKFDMADALTVIVALIAESLAGLDGLEVAS